MAEGRGWQEVLGCLGRDASLQRQGDETEAAHQWDGQIETCWAQMATELVLGARDGWWAEDGAPCPLLWSRTS